MRARGRVNGNVQMARTKERAAERAAVVEWLRSEIDNDDDNSACVLTYAANAIERGEHRREENP